MRFILVAVVVQNDFFFFFFLHKQQNLAQTFWMRNGKTALLSALIVLLPGRERMSQTGAYFTRCSRIFSQVYICVHVWEKDSEAGGGAAASAFIFTLHQDCFPLILRVFNLGSGGHFLVFQLFLELFVGKK